MSPIVENSFSAAVLVLVKASVIPNAVQAQGIWNETDYGPSYFLHLTRAGWRFVKCCYVCWSVGALVVCLCRSSVPCWRLSVSDGVPKIPKVLHICLWEMNYRINLGCAHLYSVPLLCSALEVEFRLFCSVLLINVITKIISCDNHNYHSYFNYLTYDPSPLDHT